jgi:hypothetical protein
MNTGLPYQYKENTSQVRVRKHLGTPSDPADASLLAECPDKWKDTAVLRGFTYTVIRLDLRQAEFQNGLPDINVLMKGRRLYDPRIGLTQWSSNLMDRGFVVKGDGVMRILKSPCFMSEPFHPADGELACGRIQFDAMWDTGAGSSLITHF